MRQRRVTESALRRGADPMHHSRADLAAARQLAGDLLQKAITISNVERSGRGEHGVEFVVGELEG
jgi:hypothetical protein